MEESYAFDLPTVLHRRVRDYNVLPLLQLAEAKEGLQSGSRRAASEASSSHAARA